MLVLTRRVNETIVIDNDITITVVRIQGDKVRLGIQAPRIIPVHRQEIYERIQQAIADASAAGGEQPTVPARPADVPVRNVPARSFRRASSRNE